ncbi:MAG: winged helix-turn-helix transcriptional regulator [Nitrospirales bacterium]|nr:winged helix-turn-helix transcriptional regulator [Nitrospirales bacterium]
MKESQHIEWKESWRDEYLKWICGFANAEGGVLVIGRNDKGVAVGVRDAHKLMEDIPNKVRDILGIMVDVNLREEAGKETLEIVVEPYPYPVSYKGEYHYRSGSTKQELKGAALDKFLLRKQGRHWDGVPVPYVSVSDLEARILAYFRKQALKSRRLSPETLDEPNPLLLDKLHLLEGAYLKRAAVLLFHADPERFITGAFVKIGYFESNVDLRYQDEVHGDLFSQVNQTIEILEAKYLKAWISYEGLQRIETYPVPEPALREAILNAVVHKDYASAIPIQISVYPDKLMIWNPGQLPPDWTVERLLDKHSSQPFNPDVANAFFRAGMIEAWGRGIERILNACAIAGAPTPELRYEHTGLWTVFQFKQTGEEKTPVKTPVIKPVKTPERILEVLEANPGLTLSEVASVIGKSLSAVERASARLVKEGHLRYMGPRKGGHWEVLK